MKKILTFLLLSSFLFPIQANAQTLQSYIAEAEANNPAIQAVDLRYKIAQEKVNEADWLPNTEFGVGYFVSEPETRTGAQRARFSVKQMLPWFGTIAVRENYAQFNGGSRVCGNHDCQAEIGIEHCPKLLPTLRNPSETSGVGGEYSVARNLRAVGVKFRNGWESFCGRCFAFTDSAKRNPTAKRSLGRGFYFRASCLQQSAQSGWK